MTLCSGHADWAQLWLCYDYVVGILCSSGVYVQSVSNHTALYCKSTISILSAPHLAKQHSPAGCCCSQRVWSKVHGISVPCIHVMHISLYYFHCRPKASANALQPTLSCARWFYFVPINLISSLHLTLFHTRLHFLSLAIHSGVLIDHLLSVLLMAWPFKVYVCLLISTRMSVTPVCSMIHCAVFPPLKITPVMFYSIACWVVFSFLSSSALNIRTGKIQWFYTFCFSDSGNSQVISSECLAYAHQLILIPQCIYVSRLPY